MVKHMKARNLIDEETGMPMCVPIGINATGDGPVPDDSDECVDIICWTCAVSWKNCEDTCQREISKEMK